ncbi:MAG: amino acid ABC transporter permease [Burkholderiaceae bacterium]|nr:MAG: amino acid ABC transporter permease [Burkholderiaceae bacterium]
MSRPARSARSRLSWQEPGVRAVVFQCLLLAAVAGVAWFLVSNTLANLASRNITTGFGFLHQEAGFAIGESLIPYTSADTYGRAIIVGLINTLHVSIVCIVAATVFGTLLGVARLSRNWLISRLAGGYVEIMRNIPLLLHLFFWYAIITENLPGPRQALHPLAGVFLSNRGLKLPGLQGGALDWTVGGFALAVVLALLLAHWARAHRRARGWFSAGRLACVLLVALPLAGWVLGGASVTLDLPHLRGFNFQGGITITPEFAALSIGLVVYTTAFVAEVVRSGIQSVGRGQWEAAQALGLSRSRTLRLVILPQALRVVVPPMTSQFLNVTKNSSLAIAVGYPDIVSVVNTTLNQTGQALEGILIIMAAYLAVSLLIALFMNWYNRRLALMER